MFRLLLAAAVFIEIITQQNAYAIPLVRQTAGDFTGTFVTIYPDHADPTLFYFLPNSGRIAAGADGKPLMGLTITGSQNAAPDDGMGLLTFTMEASLTPEVKQEILDFKAKHPNARMTVIPFGASFVSMLPEKKSQTGETSNVWSKLYTAMDVPPNAGVAETQIGVNMLLTEAGAKITKAMLEGGQPYNLALCFEVYGALPTMDAEIKMNYTQIYNFFQASVSAGYLWWGTTVTSVTEKLIRDGHISIKILGGDAKFDDYVKQIAGELAKTYLVPVLAANANMTGSQMLRPGIQLTVNSVYKEERTSATFRFTKQEFITDHRCVNFPMATLRSNASDIIHVID